MGLLSIDFRSIWINMEKYSNEMYLEVDFSKLTTHTNLLNGDLSSPKIPGNPSCRSKNEMALRLP